jgi:hypothetical protein
MTLLSLPKKNAHLVPKLYNITEVSRLIDKVHTEEMEKHTAEDEIRECTVAWSVLVRWARRFLERLTGRIG